ncbi:DeoR/GlpR family DNA-binding transcription regulator [Ktedonospora formicarum]|uniref:Lactose phosphotransferase system repressor n=1 Tax=Ktedonospora formicarum TaxID=2778364 RepID=A0A8J3I082_9CHLR|nr:DeoR/GlpR family DNA-binding transcription regulator [Ktedonospora formicarum]GHO44258.1 DeoR family transcriptional regulator [Ktedonospora formicarum]
MLKEQRQQRILKMLHSEGSVLASELSEALDVSEDTIRRDLRDLFEAGLIQRVHGGALLRAPSMDYVQRQEQAIEQKDEIARAAVKLIREGQVVIMDGGTTTLQVAYHLPPTLRATVITNSPPIALALSEHPLIEVILLGGKLYKPSQVTVGVETVEALKTYQADICMLGICSLHLEVGICSTELDEVYVKRAMIASSAEVVALADAKKLNMASPFVVAPLKEITHLVTEASVPEEVLEDFRYLGITTIRGELEHVTV